MIRGEKLLLGTRKGLFVLERTGRSWRSLRHAHAGIPVPYAFVDARTKLLWASLDTWGGLAVIVAVVQLVAGGLLFARKLGGVLMAIVLAMVGILMNFLSIGAYPVWSVVAMSCNALVLWAVTVHSDQFET